jgi:adenylate kinase family enzyme
MLQRIMVMGGPGSGKSTFAREMGQILDLPVYHLDRYFWNPGWVQTEWDAFADRVRQIASLDQWIIDGNYSRTLPDRLLRTDAVIYLDIPLRLRLTRVVKRRIQYHGQTREDLGEGCPERIDWVFLKQVVQYKPERHLQAIGTVRDLRGNEVTVHRLSNRTEVRRFIEEIRACSR